MLLGRIADAAEPDFLALVHTRALRLLGEPGSCASFPVRPGELATALDGLRALGFRGVSLAPAHQREALELCTTADECARLLGRAPFVSFERDGTHAGNREVEALGGRLALAGSTVRTAAVVGLGPRAGASILALARAGAQHIHLAAVNQEGAERLLHRVAPACRGVRLELAPVEALGPVLATADVVVHARDGLPLSIPASAWASRPAYLLDLECPAHGTPALLGAARIHGWKGEDGFAVLVRRAVLMLERWRGEAVPEIIEKRLRSVVRVGGAGAAKLAAAAVP